MSIHKLNISTSAKREVIDITNKVKELVRQAIDDSGVLTVFVEHTTAAITTLDSDPGTDTDLMNALGEMLPELKWHHNHKPGHAPDHLLSSIIGTSLAVPYSDGELRLGTWQRIMLLEFDGPRDRNISIVLN